MKGFLTTALVALIACVGWADGIPFDGNRVARHKTTVLVLTSNQLAVLEAERKVNAVCTIVLTATQQTQLVAEAGVAPTNVIVWSLESAQDTCTCYLLNIAIQFEPNKVEIPHYLLGADMDDRDKNFLRRIEEDRKAFTNGTPNQASQAIGAKGAPQSKR